MWFLSDSSYLNIFIISGSYGLFCTYVACRGGLLLLILLCFRIKTEICFKSWDQCYSGPAPVGSPISLTLIVTLTASRCLLELRFHFCPHSTAEGCTGPGDPPHLPFCSFHPERADRTHMWRKEKLTFSSSSCTFASLWPFSSQTRASIPAALLRHKCPAAARRRSSLQSEASFCVNCVPQRVNAAQNTFTLHKYCQVCTNWPVVYSLCPFYDLCGLPDIPWYIWDQW